jgi:hypothetical protein
VVDIYDRAQCFAMVALNLDLVALTGECALFTPEISMLKEASPAVLWPQ